MAADLVAIIPAFRCAATIGEVVRATRLQVRRVVVVDDGSHDGTGELASRSGADVRQHAENRGKGEALRTGIAAALEASPDAIVLLDGDGQHDPGEIPVLVEAWKRSGAQMVIGSRWSDPAKIPGERYWTNYIGSRVLAWMSGLDLEDTQSGFRLLEVKLAAELKLRHRGYAIETEMLLKAARKGARIVNVPIRAIYEDGPSHFRPVLDTFRISCAAVYTKVFDDG
jgi:glycosyltransferase involved in cell wall biosynthesis